MKLANLKGIFKKNFIVGLDIGATSVKIAQFQKREDGLYLTKADVKEIKPADNQAAGEQEIVEILRVLLGGIEKIKSQIIVSINCPYTAVRRVIVPYMPKQELRDCINLGAKNYFPFPVNNSLLDSEILGDIFRKGVKQYEAILAVSSKATIDWYLSLLEKAGINAVSIIPVPIALQRLAEVSYAKEGRVMCFIYMGELHTELIISIGKNLIFSRKIPIAGADFTRALTGVLVSDRGRIELNLLEAEKIKQEIGIPAESESKIINDKISTVQILSMLRAPLAQLVNEIERCFDYYKEESEGGQIESLVLFGAGSSLKGLTKFLSGELGLEVSLGDPLQGLKISPDALRQRDKVPHGLLAVAIGSALSQARGINLLPLEIKEKTKRLFKRTTFEIIVSVIIMVLAFFYIGIRIKLNNYQKKITVAKLELSSLEPQLKQARVFSLLTGEPYWKDVFKEVSNLVPGDIYLTRLSLKYKTITISGSLLSERGQERVSSFMLKLQEGIFKNVKLASSKLISEKATKKFVINCLVDEK